MGSVTSQTIEELREPESPPREQLVFNLIAFRDGRVHRAICPELGMLVVRNELTEAMQELVDLVVTYVHDGVSRGLTYEQLRRPIPRSESLKLYLLKLTPLIIQGTLRALLRRSTNFDSFELRHQAV